MSGEPQFIAIAGRPLEYAWFGAGREALAPVVMLHEGLGSLAMWREFPARLAAATGRRVLAYSRLGYGRSARLAGPRSADYMHREAIDTLPALREALGLADPVLLGHSDGASIALIHAGAGRWPVRGLILEAPHVFVEEVTVRSIAAAREAWSQTDMARRLARYHDDAEGAFRGWNDIWLDPDFRNWNIESFLPAITAPTLLIQGAKDEYGTLAQLDAIETGLASRCERLVLPDCRHAPHRDQPDATLAAIARFLRNL